MAKTNTRNAILKTDETIDVTQTDVKRTPVKKTINKSRKRTSLDEFAITNSIRPEVKAGFKAWLKGQYFHFDEEWKELFDKYNRR